MKLMELVESAPWREAVTYRDTWPHEYVLTCRDDCADLLALIVERWKAGEGVKGRFFRMENTYLFIGDYKKQVELPEDCTNLGDHAVVITNAKEFFMRVKAAAGREGYGINGRLVKYYDPNVGTPPSGSQIESIFTKRNQYAYQKEFRIAIDTRTLGIDPITLNIGPIDDIALHLKTGDINRGLTLKLPPLT